MAKQNAPLTDAEKEEKRRKKRANDDVMAIRRERVATLRGRGLSLREIQSTLGAETITISGEKKKNPNQFLNPETGAAYDLATIQRDCAYLAEQWKKNAAASTDEHRARQLFEIQEIKRAAWAARDPHLALMALDKEIKLLGTAMPERLEHSMDADQLDKLTDHDELLNKLDELSRRLTPPQDDLNSASTPA